MKAAREQDHVSYAFGPFRLDPAERMLLRDGEVVPLLPKSFDALLVLVRNAGRLLEKSFLMAEIWPDAEVEENSLAKAISDVRRALGEGPKDQHYVVTVPRRGYRFVADVTVLRSEPVDEPGPAARLGTVAVLPFAHLSSDAADGYLTVGMADALITRLSNIRHVVVRPTSSVLKYADAGTDPVVAGRELQVDAVISGGIRRSGERVRVTVQFVNVERESSVWAEKYDVELTDIFAVEDSVSERVAAALALRLSGEERRSLTRRYTENTEAHQLYLRGRYFWSKRSVDAARKAIECFRRAIALDSGYALAYAGLADAHIVFGLQGAITGWLPPHDVYPEANRAVSRALELDGTLAEAHATYGFIRFFYDWDWAGAEEAFLRALELNPHYAPARHWYAMAVMFAGRRDEALAEIDRALEIEPFSLILNANKGYALYYARRHDDAIAQLQRTIEMEPTFMIAHHRLGLAYEAKGMYEQAVAELEEATTLSESSPLAMGALGRAYALSGRRDAAEQIVERLRERRESYFVSAAVIADVYVGLGDTARALDWLEEAFDERAGQLTKLVVDPRYDSLRTDPRFGELVRRVGLWTP